MQNIDTILYTTSSGVSLSDIAIKDINVNTQVTVTDPQDYTKERHTNLKHVSQSM